MITSITGRLNRLNWEILVVILSITAALLATAYSYLNGYIIAYGDAESHLNISKRVIDSLTPGFAQFGGIWLPLPHALMLPFVNFDLLWRSGLAGSVVSGISFIITSLFIYKLIYLTTESRFASVLGSLIFIVNPNILYLQSTPMTEVPLIAFFVLSSYFFIKYLKNDGDLLSLILAAFFSFCASLSRYDGWFLVIVQASIIVMKYIFDKQKWKELEGKFILFSTLAFFGIALWLLWDYIILGDPFYFTNSPFSAKSQQSNWLARGELPAYRDIIQSFLYYTITTLRNSGIFVFVLSLIGYIYYLIKERSKDAFFNSAILLVPFMFYVVTLYMGQSVVFIPDLTPETYEWRLFNVRYGIVMLPAIAFFFAYLAARSHVFVKGILILLLFLQTASFAYGFEPVISLDDGIKGLSSSKKVDATSWMSTNYDGGLVLMDDYARTMSILRTNIPMNQVIYIGNRPYWEESLKDPEKYAKWVVAQKDDSVWKNILDNPEKEAQLYKYFNKAYTSPDILIFKRIEDGSVAEASSASP